MKVKVRVFAGLAERLGFSETDLEINEGQTVADIWDKLNEDDSLPDTVLVAINMDYAKPEATVSDGDEVAFFPPVTGG